MPRFFVEPEALCGDTVRLTGENARHIGRALRMRAGDLLTLCDGAGTDCRCELIGFDAQSATARILSREPCPNEPALRATLYMGLPKADKLEWVIQKATELGVARIVPVLCERCVARLSGPEFEKKQNRFCQIATEASKQSGRGVVPAVEAPLTFAEAVEQIAAEEGPGFLLYEGARTHAADALREQVGPETARASFLVGPEGGITAGEAARCGESGMILAGLGPRILRCETAPIVFLSILMYLSGNI